MTINGLPIIVKTRFGYTCQGSAGATSGDTRAIAFQEYQKLVQTRRKLSTKVVSV